MSESRADLSIIIVNWNTRDLLAQCLKSILAATHQSSLDVWVVDNASRDDSLAMVRTQFPNVHVLANHQNVGFSSANNQAIKTSASPYVLFLNSDTMVQPHALKEIVAFMHSTPRAGIVGANVINPDGSPQRCFGKFPTLLSESIYAWGLDTRLPIERQVVLDGHAVETDWVLGAALAARRDALVQVGGFDEAYFMYSEEVDLCYRVKQAGWRNFILPSAHVVHFGGESTRQMPAAMKAELFRSKVRYFRKHRGALAANVMHLMFGASIWGRRVAHTLRGRKEASALWTEAWTHFIKARRQESQ